MSDKELWTDVNLHEPTSFRKQRERLSNVQELQVGNQSTGTGKIMRSDRKGLWLGAAKKEDAPFSVDMDGNLIANSGTFAGTIYWSNVNDDDGNKPEDNADVTGNNTAKDIVNLPDSPGSAGLYADGQYLGYYDGSSWQVYIENNGDFYFNGDGSNYISYDGSTLTVRGDLTADDITAGTLTAIDISGSTITGSTLQTDSSGKRILIGVNDQSRIDLINSNGNDVGVIYADTSDSLKIWNPNNGSAIKFYADDSGGITTDIGYIDASDVSFNVDLNANHILPQSANNYDLGGSGSEWRNLYIGGTVSATVAQITNSEGLQVYYSHTPSSASASGAQGTIAWDSDYIYVCVASDTWKRVGISSW